MEFWKSLSGMLTVEFTGAEPERILAAITKARIPVSYVVQKHELVYQIQIRRKDYMQLCAILERQGSSVTIIRKQGFYWQLRSFISRPVLMSVMLMLLCSSFYLPSRIFFVSVAGNRAIPDQQILSAAESCGIRFGASRKHVRSEKVKNALLSSVPQLQWAGINTTGCRAIISVRERREEEAQSNENLVSSLIADRDGFILSATVTSGTPQCAPGDTVTKGQVLISGYTDCGICIRTSRAEGEVFAQTSRKLTAVTPANYDVTKEMTDVKYKISLLIGKKRINLWKDSRISEAGCGRMYEEYYVSLPGGFQLPVAISIDQYQEYALEEIMVSEEVAMEQLQSFSDRYLVGQMVAGQIIRKQQDFSSDLGLYQLDSSYTCTEMIGRERREEIGEINGKRN